MITQKRLNTLGEASKQAMEIEAMEHYLGSFHMM
jgi:hypothetical protein